MKKSISLFALSLVFLFWGCGDASPGVKMEIFGRCFVTTKDLFLYEQDSRYFLQPPGTSNLVPPSVELYRAHPKDWADTDEYNRYRGSSDSAKGRLEILAVVPKGTSICVSGARPFKAMGTTIWVVDGTLEDSKFSHLKVSFMSLFNGNAGRQPNITPRDEYLRAES
jgi:hypothetical protein